MPAVRQERNRESAVVFNPAKVSDLDQLRETVDGALASAGWPAPRWLETTADDPGYGQTRAAVEAGAGVVFVCGGDGTVMSALGALVGTETAMAILPAGTGNLLAANLGISTDLAAGIQVALDGGERRIDVGVVDDRHFAVMAGMGFDARMLEDTSDTVKARIGWPAYVLGALRHLRDRPMRLTIRVDDGPPMRRRARSVLIANVGRLQGGVKLMADATPDDGLLDVAVLTPRTLRHWAALGLAVVRHRTRVPSMQVLQGARVEVRSDRPQPRQLDGDLIEPGDALVVEVRPEAVWLCVPQPAEHPDLAEDAEAAARRGARLVEAKPAH
ncbi:sphingosine kinase [Asanoa ishikariensis]|uniref:Diacylglycerol kinase family enzyme n=1 Tax=Asanoa ishikariensis TaxID=137265 RepID=A0A1H3T2V9_9ACTN|nr:diacylglycerol kinase family protein [Asanoa ishikariensis]GIF63115.1 sphingosine kinase [Asanoa ishikariensis]SDZ44198.1 Diacylglycerol kinase family enzyme [Asanoa ishikariensis]